MADREQTVLRFTKKNKQHKTLRQDPQYRQRREQTKRERERVLEAAEAEREIKDFIK